ncbi:YihY/virulence factor BrkB family protein [Aeromicrobium sp. CTD01-1L150]|uniref:YihY/virulence factor BrkB family protein n=1 Tax=Aeromicrobium sp. CTD01-1L150 TaxID=3341830 RepID=UPI0035C146B7
MPGSVLKRWAIVDLLARIAASTFRRCFHNRVTGLAAEAAFFAILSLPPLVFGLAGSIGFIARRYDVTQVDVFEERVLALASQALTPSTVDQVIAPTLDEVLSSGRIDVVSIGFVLALWSGSRALNVFFDTITIMYGLGGERGIVKTRALSFLLYVVALLIGIVLVPLVLAGPEVAAEFVPAELSVLEPLYWPAVLVVSVGFLATLYHLAVPVRVSWRSSLPGAAFTMVLWVVGSAVVRWALGFSTGGTSIYGPLAAPIAVLLWLYVLSIAVLIGAALNSALDTERHPGRVRQDTADGEPQGSR